MCLQLTSRCLLKFHLRTFCKSVPFVIFFNYITVVVLVSRADWLFPLDIRTLCVRNDLLHRSNVYNQFKFLARDNATKYMRNNSCKFDPCALFVLNALWKTTTLSNSNPFTR